MQNTPTQHGYKAQHYTVTTLHTLNNTEAKVFNQMVPHARIITVALNMSKAFDTINRHTLMRQLLHTSNPSKIIKFILNYIKGRNPTQHTETTHPYNVNLKTGVTHGGVISSTLFIIYISDLPPPRAPVHVMSYADDIAITSTHTSMTAAKKYIQPYLHKVFVWKKQYHHTLNPDKTTCTLFTPDPAENKSNLDLKVKNTALPMATHPEDLGLTLDPKLT